MTVMNTTTDSLSAVASVSPAFGWLITLAIFLGVLGVIFLLSKNFRRFIYGAVVSGILLINFKFSRWIGVSAVESNFEPLKWTGYIIGFIVGSIIIGRLLQKLKFVRNLEKKLTCPPPKRKWKKQ